MVADSTATPGPVKISPVVVGFFENETRTGAKHFNGCRVTIGKRDWVRANGVVAAESETRSNQL
jgi:hypothetical protein